MYKIYMLYSNYNPERIYVGKTIQSLKTRLSNHRCHYRRYLKGDYGKNCSSYKIFNDYGIDNIHIELLEETYNSKDEFWWIQLLGTENDIDGSFDLEQWTINYNKTEKRRKKWKNDNSKLGALRYLKHLFK